MECARILEKGIGTSLARGRKGSHGTLRKEEGRKTVEVQHPEKQTRFGTKNSQGHERLNTVVISRKINQRKKL